MTEYIFITCGGSGHRLQETMPYPKAMYMLPDGQTVLGRLLDQLPRYTSHIPVNFLDSGNQCVAKMKYRQPVKFCTGYKSFMIKELFPIPEQIETYDVENPTNILHCFKQVMDKFKQLSYTFILGDTIWHPKALEQALSQRFNKAIMVYRNRNKAVCENYMITFSGVGIDLFKEVYALGELPPALPQERGKIPIDQCKILHLANHLAGKKRRKNDPRFGGYVNDYPVTDFDTQEQLDRVLAQYKQGVYDDAGS